MFVPGWEDSTLGNIFASYCIKGEVNETAVKSGIQYMMELTEWYKATSEPIGFLQLGGGIAGDFPICVVPMIRQDMGEEGSVMVLVRTDIRVYSLLWGIFWSSSK